jgi:hypothetical protein
MMGGSFAYSLILCERPDLVGWFKWNESVLAAKEVAGLSQDPDCSKTLTASTEVIKSQWFYT